MKITLTARALHGLVKPVMPLAEREGMLPVLNAVLIEYQDGYLTATATDRFRIGICRREYEATSAFEFRALVRLADVRNLLALFKVGRGKDGNEVTLSVEGTRIYAEASGGLGFNFSDLRVGYELEQGEYPGIRRLIREALTTESVEGFAGLNPGFLADWRHVGDETLTVKIVAPDKPVIITAGDHFLGLQMPRRITSGPNVGDVGTWPDFLADKPAKKTGGKARAKKAVA